MKKILFLFLGLSFLAISCQDDPVVINADLHLDGVNNTAPIFDPSIYTCAVRFSAGVTSGFFGKDIEEIEFHLTDIPNQIIVQVFAEGTRTLPGTLLYEADVTSSVIANSWNRHTLTSPVSIVGEDIWVAVEISQSNRIATIGCDSGPAVSDGDWVNTNERMRWETFRELTGTESINWNIRANVSE